MLIEFHQNILMVVPYIAFVLISVLAIIVTVYDKNAANRKPKERVSESGLLAVSLLGGSVAMYFTMLLIRHKTKHKKFMIGLPLIIMFQIILLAMMAYFCGQI